MGNSLGEYIIAKYSSSNINNIKSSQRNPVDPDKPKNKKKKRNTSPTNIIYTSNPKVKSDTVKLFKIKNDGTIRLKKKEKTRKKFLNSSSSNYFIKQGFKRPGR